MRKFTDSKNKELAALAVQVGKELTECKELVEAGREAEIPESKVARINALNEKLERKAKAAGYRDSDDFLDTLLAEDSNC